MNLATAHPRAALLTKRQRVTLATLARRCFVVLAKYGNADGDFHAWRRITEAQHRHYLPLYAHFSCLMGRPGVAAKKVLQAETASRAYALAKLSRECQAARVTLAYPRAIARKKYRTGDLEALTGQQLWRLTYCVRRLAKKAAAMQRGGIKGGDALAAVIGATLAKAQMRGGRARGKI
ncbi:MAG: hypothetical protein LBD30_07335 [Verrucomicrobiales bacterium]|jgi:hypothetical protein|nr:hypothetical protein [Verrucomicrobiales bacterium]